MIDRFLSLPMARPAFLAGRTLAGLSRAALTLGFLIGLGYSSASGSTPAPARRWPAWP
jgi:hypothetical protein